MSFEKIVADVHRLVDEERKAKGLQPWDWNKPNTKLRRNNGAARLAAFAKWATQKARAMAAKAGK